MTEMYFLIQLDPSGPACFKIEIIPPSVPILICTSARLDWLHRDSKIFILTALALAIGEIGLGPKGSLC